MAVATMQLAQAALVDVGTVAIALVALAPAIRFWVKSAWLVLGGAVEGVMARYLGVGA